MPVLPAPEAPVKPLRAGVAGRPAAPRFLDRFFRNGVIRRLERLDAGSLRLREGERIHTIGQATTGDAVEISVHDARFFRELALRGSLGAADGYVNGWWSCDDLVALFRLFCRNAQAMADMDRGAARLFAFAGFLGHLRRRNSLTGSRRNIASHYDLGDDFFALFLDETMTYSAGIFARPECSLTEASLEKYERICQRLELSPGDHVLEIGGGWGGFALHAAKNYGCRVTTTTISRKQHDYARARIHETGLDRRVTVLCEDYRALQGRYDKLVSIEMVEAVGHEYLDTFFSRCSELLRPAGRMFLQAITIPDHRYDSYRRSVDFIQQYIFPGGCLPSIAAIGASLRRSTDFRWSHLEDVGLHYAETLARWRGRFWRNIDEVRRQGFDDRFIRMWDYYLCYCEAGFREREIGTAQIVFEKPGSRS